MYRMTFCLLFTLSYTFLKMLLCCFIVPADCCFIIYPSQSLQTMYRLYLLPMYSCFMGHHAHTVSMVQTGLCFHISTFKYDVSIIVLTHQEYLLFNSHSYLECVSCIRERETCWPSSPHLFTFRSTSAPLHVHSASSEEEPHGMNSLNRKCINHWLHERESRNQTVFLCWNTLLTVCQLICYNLI